MDITVAARNALSQMIDWLAATFDFSPEAAYALCSVALDLRLSQVVDYPSALVSASIHLSIFAYVPLNALQAGEPARPQ